MSIVSESERDSLQYSSSIEYVDYKDESMLSDIQCLVSKDLSEPYSIFTFRYFLHNWPRLCICTYAVDKEGNRLDMVGTIVCKADVERDGTHKGYVAMLAVNQNYRKQGIGSKLVSMGLDRMVEMGCDEIMLEAEASNTGALYLYEKLGFIRDEKLGRYYLNGGDAFRLRLWVDKKADSNNSNSNNHDELSAQQIEAA